MIENELARREAELLSQQIQREGYTAFLLGTPRANNPYRQPAPAWDDWNEGWLDACDDYGEENERDTDD